MTVSTVPRLHYWGWLLLAAGVAAFASAMILDKEKGFVASPAYPLASLLVFVGIFCLTAHYLRKDDPR